ncbi:MarR family winged helix-turn-helix transcriptional regulator [Algihabitans albus]|uniref:MarR family winged helix-turn-helix transcriptional regulator n=1 Tax=Algihabitans albus TaxID=2164067 RepID=UPI000E5D3150|nr:MarR family transcriptional regulator [Algihabitans albus]
MDRIEDCISFLIGKAQQQVARRARDKLAPFGITPVQYAVLHALWQQDGQSGAELGARLAIDSATITGIMDRLEAAELIARRPDEAGDRRINRAALTDRAQQLRSPLDRAMDELNAEVVAELGRQDATLLWAGLQRLGRVGVEESASNKTGRRNQAGR